MKIILEGFYFVLSGIDFVSIWVGRSVAIILCIIVLYFIFRYFFCIPYCYNCGSRKTDELFGNNAGGYNCSKCDTYYWYEKGKSFKKDPKGFFNRLFEE